MKCKRPSSPSPSKRRQQQATARRVSDLYHELCDLGVSEALAFEFAERTRENRDAPFEGHDLTRALLDAAGGKTG